MNKWYGAIGYISTVETEPGVWKEVVTETKLYGDVLEQTSRWNSSNKVNDDTDITARISVMADPYAYQNFSKIKFAEFMDAMWEVKSASPKHPRLIITLGGVYSGERAQAQTA